MTSILAGPVTVSVPATSANLGPGFDALGLALEHRDTVTARVLETTEAGHGGLAGRPRIAVRGVGEGQVPLDEAHLVHRAMCAAFERMDARLPVVSLDCVNVVPHARGLVAGGSLLMDDDAVFALAADLEGHPDNVAPAFFGGCTVAYRDGDRFRAAAVSVDPRVQVVAFVPPDGVQTSVARGLLPDVVPFGDAARNAGRAALLVAALGGRPELLLAATEDRLHQDYREPAMPESLRLVRELRAEGLPAVVSGAGPTVLVFTDAMGRIEVARRAPSGWATLVVPIDRHGARVELPDEAART